MKKLVLIVFIAILFFTGFQNFSLSRENKYLFDIKITGSGEESIIFIPGFSCSGDVWNETVTDYKGRYTCYVLTMAGFADAETKPDPTFTGWEISIADYIKDNKINKPIIIGHSMGGGLALALAADYPDLISKIVVVDALPCLAALMNPDFKSEENDDCGEMVNTIVAMTDEEFKTMLDKNMPMLSSDTSKHNLIKSWSIQSDRTTYAKMFCDFSNTDLREKMSGIKCPALILLESYFVYSKPAIEEQYKNLKTADLKYSNKGLHFVMYDDKEWYDQKLKDFIGK